MSIYENTVDGGAYSLVVTRIDDRTGRLLVAHVPSSTTLLDATVHLSYGARFGPDVDDVALWQETALKVIDEHIAQQGDTQ